jgi:F0F1-type ATP synthase assembly protein I
MAGEKEPHWGKGLATGFEMAVGVALGFFVGQWLGKKYGWEPWASLIGAMLGLVAGAYLLIKEVNRDNKPKS